MATLGIPKRLGHIWIGPYDPPSEWMETWVRHHPDWQYTLYDNQYLHRTSFKTQAQIDEYWRRGEYAGVSDLMRYEILLEQGGLIPPSDSICYHNTDELFPRACAYTVYENEFLKGALVSPVYACNPGNAFVKLLVETLSELDPKRMDRPWKTTGNLFLAQMIRKHKPDIIIFPSHYFIPVHYEGEVYEGDDKVYAKEMFGSTRKLHVKNSLSHKARRVKQSWIRKLSRIRGRRRAHDGFHQNYS